MTHASQEPMIRSVVTLDTTEITELLAAVMWHRPAARRPSPNPVPAGALLNRDPVLDRNPGPNRDPVLDRDPALNRGIVLDRGTALNRDHVRLDAAGSLANQSGNRDLYRRHGCQVRSVTGQPEAAHWTMWRSPMN